MCSGPTPIRQMPLPRKMFLIYLAQDLIAVGRSADARPHLSAGAGGGPDAYVMDLLGQAHRMQGDFDDAERCWLRSIEWDDRRSWPWLLLGKLELQRNRPEEAIARARAGRRAAPTSYEPAYSLSLAYRRVGKDRGGGPVPGAGRPPPQAGPPAAPGGMGTLPSPKS